MIDKMLEYMEYIMLGVMALAALGLLFYRQGNRRHAKYIKSGERVLKKLSELHNDQARFAYLRKVNPYVFEELVLSSFERKGYKIKRNKRYSGDGGIDGRVYLNGQLYLVQAKRYSKHINPQHVKALEGAMQREGAKGGYFVHTGRTGAHSWEVVHPSIQIISGVKLMELVRYHI